jgi:pyruvate formate lyase activating enzyme
MKENLKEAVLAESVAGGKVRCSLCNFRCLINTGDVGHCRVRKNIDGKLYSLNYHRLCAANIDPIEKKPLFHFQPGSKSFSIAALGCNFQCQFCQNWQISQVDPGQISGTEKTEPEKIVASAMAGRCKSIAYTYTEPTIFMEICNDCGTLAKKKGLANIFVSNGYMTKEAIDFASGWLDGINIDLKSFRDDYYKNLCGAKLAPVLNTIEHIARNTNIWLEITTLVVPGANDSDDELRQIAEFIAGLNCDIPWHISRFYPQYKYTDSAPTSGETLQRAYEIAKKAGLHYIYIGNLPIAKTENTYCPKCDKLLIERLGYTIKADTLKKEACPDCETTIAGFEL